MQETGQASSKAGATKAAAREREREARLARKLERAEDLDYLMLWTRTPDTQVLRGMLYALDRACARVRAVTASLEMPLGEGQGLLARAQLWLDQLEGIVAGGEALVASLSGWAGMETVGSEPPKSVQEKQAMRVYRKAVAAQPGVDFYLPRSPEGRRMVQLLSAVDARVIRARASEQLEEAGMLLQRMGQLIREGHALVTELAERTRIDYMPHPILKRALKAERAAQAQSGLAAQGSAVKVAEAEALSALMGASE